MHLPSRSRVRVRTRPRPGFRCAVFALLAALAGCGNAGDSLSRPAALTETRTTPRFVLHSDLTGAELDFQVRWFDAFWTWFEAHYFEVPTAKKPLWIWLFGDAAKFEAWNRARGGEGSSGFYAVGEGGQSVLVVDLDTGVGTATHEFVHHFVWQAFGERAPHWLNEGFAAFFEKFLGRLGDDGRLELSVGYFSNWRFPIAKRDVDGYSLAQLFAAGSDVDQCAARSLMLYLHRQGKLQPFVLAMRERTDDADGSATLARVFGAPLPELERAWKDWIRAQPIDRDVALVTQSLVLDEKGWARWIARNDVRIRWDEEQQRYVPR